MPIPCQQLVKVLTTLCGEVNSPLALEVSRLANGGQWLQLQKLKVNPALYTDSETLFKDNLVVDFLRKADIDTSVDKVGAASSIFFSCEATNKMTNDRLSRFLDESLLIEDSSENAIYEFILDVRKEVEFILGRLPNDLTPSFGGGSTYDDKGQLITVPDKMSSRPTLTGNSVDLVVPLFRGSAWDRALPSDISSAMKIVRGNRFSTVPKDASKHRGIGVEPSLNISYQLAVGKILKRKLMKIGIDLKHGQSTHRDRALAASVTGLDATIDLSNASDNICYRLVKLLLPQEWYELLDSLRSPMTKVKGKWVKLEKFSSMGNGYTFELESLIFSALVRGAVRRGSGKTHRVFVYGDDIICPVEDSVAVLGVLKFFGFTPNNNKTFLDGLFRESCGGDFFYGMPVRAHFIENLPYEPQHWITLANGIRRLAFADSRCHHRWQYLRSAWRLCISALPSHIRRLTGPSYLGDVVIHSELYTSVQRVLKDHSTCTLVRGYVPVPVVLKWHHWKPAVQLASALKSFPSTGVTPRGAVTGYRVGWIPLYGVSS